MAVEPKVRVLFVCLGNICRSPMAEGVFRKLVREAGLENRIDTDSAGTHAYHVGAPPDERAQAAARMRGIDISDLRGRKLEIDDIRRFDYVLVMDDENYSNAMEICPPGEEKKVRMFLSYARRGTAREVPDPYFGSATGFDRVLDMIEDAAAGLLDDVRRRLRS